MSASYPAEIFRPGSGARARPGTLTVDGDRLCFLAAEDEDDVELVLPTRGLSCRLSGYDNRTFFFTHLTADGAEVAVKDSRIAQDEHLRELAVFQEARRVGAATHRRFWGCIALLAFGVLLLLAGVGTVAALFLRWLLS